MLDICLGSNAFDARSNITTYSTEDLDTCFTNASNPPAAPQYAVKLSWVQMLPSIPTLVSQLTQRFHDITLL